MNDETSPNDDENTNPSENPDGADPTNENTGGDNSGGDNAGAPGSTNEDGQFTQSLKHKQVSARVPDNISPGVFASSSLVLNGQNEFIIDFLQTVTRPHRVAQRVVLPPNVVRSMITALQTNLDNFSKRFGPPPELPKPPPNAKPPSVEDIYAQLKLDDQTATGAYANTVMITHSASEFCFDFITSFFPQTTVAARIFIASQQAPRLLQTLTQSYDQYQRKLAAQQQAMRDQQEQQRLDEGDTPPPPFTSDDSDTPPADTDHPNN